MGGLAELGSAREQLGEATESGLQTTLDSHQGIKKAVGFESRPKQRKKELKIHSQLLFLKKSTLEVIDQAY